MTAESKKKKMSKKSITRYYVNKTGSGLKRHWIKFRL